MARVLLENLVKEYAGGRGVPDTRVVKGITLEIRDRELMVLVGPSGCGKSTTLRMIAGLEDITSGTVSLDGQVINDVAPKDRDMAMVFQNYALYPHLSVYDNMAFGLRMRGHPRTEIAQRVREAAALLGLEPYLGRKPKALSGGQRQRVALGRAIVRKPRVFLFDEPLSNLDAKMRASTRAEIARLRARLGTTLIYVTHDQAEAMTLGDRICVMHAGEIMQVAPPREIYERPANLFVAGFIGSPPMNLLRGTLVAAQGLFVFQEDRGPALDGAGAQGSARGDRPAQAPAAADPAGPASPLGPEPALTLALPPGDQDLSRWLGARVVLGLRPEHIRDAGQRASVAGAERQGGPLPTAVLTAEVVEPLGAETLVHARSSTALIVARVAPESPCRAGEALTLLFDTSRARLFEAESGKAIAWTPSHPP